MAITKEGRRPCCIPFCRRTFKAPNHDLEIMCGRHWRLADVKWRRLHSLVMRRWRAGKIGDDRAVKLEGMLFDKIKAQAATRG